MENRLGIRLYQSIALAVYDLCRATDIVLLQLGLTVVNADH